MKFKRFVVVMTAVMILGVVFNFQKANAASQILACCILLCSRNGAWNLVDRKATKTDQILRVWAQEKVFRKTTVLLDNTGNNNCYNCYYKA